MSAELQFDITTRGGAAARGDLRATRSELAGLGSETSRLGSASGSAHGKLSKLGSAVGLAARTMGPLAAAAGAGAVLKLGADSLSVASQTQQAFGAVDAVFGRNARTVKAWANSAVNDVGLARDQYAQMAAVLGASLKNSGIKDYAGQTKQLIKLGADLSATFGGTTSEAVEALGSLLRGETDPIERYGVQIKQSGVNALLAARGQQNLTGKARAAAEQQARLTLLMRQTTKAQGQFGRETNTLAHKQQQLGNQFRNIEGTIGKRLLPVGTRLLGWLSRTIAGSNSTGRTVRKLGSVYGSYLRPMLSAAGRAVQIVTKAFQQNAGRGDGLGKVLRSVGRFAAWLAPIMGHELGNGILRAATAISTGIRVANGFINSIRQIGSWAASAASAVGNLASKLASIGGGAVSKIAGLFRSSPSAGLTRAGLLPAYSSTRQAYASPVSFSPSLSFGSPQIYVTIGARQFEAQITRVVDARLREQARKEAGGWRP